MKNVLRELPKKSWSLIETLDQIMDDNNEFPIAVGSLYDQWHRMNIQALRDLKVLLVTEELNAWYTVCLNIDGMPPEYLEYVTFRKLQK